MGAFYGAGVEYALHTLLNLALASTESAPSARDLADFQRLPVPYMRKLMTQLEKARIVRAAEGLRGGWRLSRSAEEISILDVADAINGNVPLFACNEIRSRCVLWRDGTAPQTSIAGICTIHGAMLSAEAAMRKELACRSIGSIADEVRERASSAFVTRSKAWFENRATGRGQRAGE